MLNQLKGTMEIPQGNVRFDSNNVLRENTGLMFQKGNYMQGTVIPAPDRKEYPDCHGIRSELVVASLL
jgi:hypothetical protein